MMRYFALLAGTSLAAVAASANPPADTNPTQGTPASTATIEIKPPPQTEAWGNKDLLRVKPHIEIDTTPKNPNDTRFYVKPTIDAPLNPNVPNKGVTELEGGAVIPIP